MNSLPTNNCNIKYVDNFHMKVRRIDRINSIKIYLYDKHFRYLEIIL